MRIRVRTTSVVRWLVASAFAVNLALIAFAFIARAEGSGEQRQGAGTEPATPAASQPAATPTPAPEVTQSEAVHAGEDSPAFLEAEGEQRLLQEIRDLADELRREKERIAARREGMEASQANPAAAPAAAAAPDAEVTDPFDRLIAAFENMEPETSAAALLPLYGKDREAALRVLLEISTRQAGAVMDALATLSPDTTAAIAHDIHSRSPTARSAAQGKNLPPTRGR